MRAETGRNGSVTDERGTKRASADQASPHDGSGRVSRGQEPDQVLTSREARQFLRIGRTKLHELTQRQIIPAYRIGAGRTSALRYLRSDLMTWLVRQRV